MAGIPTSVWPGALAGRAVKTCWQRVHCTDEPSGASSASSSSYMVEHRSQRMIEGDLRPRAAHQRNPGWSWSPRGVRAGERPVVADIASAGRACASRFGPMPCTRSRLSTEAKGPCSERWRTILARERSGEPGDVGEDLGRRRVGIHRQAERHPLVVPERPRRARVAGAAEPVAWRVPTTLRSARPRRRGLLEHGAERHRGHHGQDEHQAGEQAGHSRCAKQGPVQPSPVGIPRWNSALESARRAG